MRVDLRSVAGCYQGAPEALTAARPHHEASRRSAERQAAERVLGEAWFAPPVGEQEDEQGGPS